MSTRKRLIAVMAGMAALLAGSLAWADEDDDLRMECSRFERNLALSGQVRAGGRVIEDFALFAGSRENAGSLFAGLREGKAITLVAPSVHGQPVKRLAFTVPEGRLAGGEAYITLEVARQQLRNLGVTTPAPEQIRAALVGGTVSVEEGVRIRSVQLPGVLVLRSRSASWPGITRSLGVDLMAVIGAMQRTNRDLVALHWHGLGTGFGL